VGKELSSAPAMNQEDWKAVLQELKMGNKDTLEKLHIDKKSIRIEGPGTSGGGNESDAEFYYLAGQTLNDFDALKIQTSEITALKKAFLKLKAEKSVFFVDQKLVLEGREKAAINDYDVFVIVFNEARWNESSFAQKRKLIVHELLGLARAFDRSIDDSAYEISNGLFERLDDANQKEFLMKSDYPKFFKPATSLNTIMVNPQGLIYTNNGKSESCVTTGDEPVVRLENKTVLKDGRPYLDISFRIQCRLPDGNIFGHSQGGYSDDLLELVSGNLLHLKNDFGRFVVGWMSGDDFMVRSPMMMLSVTKRPDGKFDFIFEFKKGGAQESYRAILSR
jgi:hypothetical protein